MISVLICAVSPHNLCAPITKESSSGETDSSDTETDHKRYFALISYAHFSEYHLSACWPRLNNQSQQPGWCTHSQMPHAIHAVIIIIGGTQAFNSQFSRECSCVAHMSSSPCASDFLYVRFLAVTVMAASVFHYECAWLWYFSSIYSYSAYCHLMIYLILSVVFFIPSYHVKPFLSGLTAY